MQTDVKTDRHGQREVTNFKGLWTALQDARATPDGYQGVARNIVYDENGNARPKDGSSQWWAPLSQRKYLAEMEPAENGTWTGGSTDAAVFAYGAQSRRVNAAGATNLDRVPASLLDLLLSGGYTEAQTSFAINVDAINPADVTSCIVYMSSGANFAANTRSWDITANVNALTMAAWTAITKTLASGTNIGGAPDFSAITRMRIAVTCTAGTAIYFDEWFVSYSVYTKSIPLGGTEFKRISNSARYTVAGFGETIFSDINEARTPVKLLSQRTRNSPHYFDIAEDRLAIFNGIDDNMIFTGTTIRKLGYPAPTAWVPGFTYAAGGSLTATGVYYYGITFVYGLGAVQYGQSTMFQSSTAATIPGGNGTANLAAIPTGGVGAGVIARRVYRCQANAGAAASKFFVAEISDNTTTTYVDTLSDADLVAGQQGPINNGVPPICKMGVWFQKGMVYIDKGNIYWSRPGSDLNGSFEIVPAENILVMGNMGTQVGLQEFNSNLYLFAKGGLGKLIWRGSVLEYYPVQRTSEGRAQNVGCYDGRAVTIIQDRLMRWQDCEGQVWDMLPNEEIYPRSKPVANMVDDFNYLPLATTLDYERYDSSAQFAAGTVGSNLTTTEQDGQLRYKDTELTTQSPVLSSFTPSGTAMSISTLPGTSGGNDGSRCRRLNANGQYLEIRLNAQQLVRLNRFKFEVFVDYAFEGSGTLQYSIAAYKINYAGDRLAAGAAIASDSGTVTLGPDGTIPLNFLPIYIPAGESLIFRLTRTGGSVAVAYIRHSESSTTFNLNGQTVFTMDVTHNPDNQGNGLGVFAEIENSVAYLGSETLTTAGTPIVNSLQRWIRAGMAAPTTLLAGQSLSVVAEFSPDNVLWYFGQVVYTKTFLNEVGALEPSTSEQYYRITVPDYRVGQPFPSGTQYAYFRLKMTIDPRRTFTPLDVSQTKIGTASIVPAIVAVGLKYSDEVSFTTYNKANYTNDIWTGPIVNAVSVVTWGRLSATYFENQQLMTFQVRTANGSGGIAAATWFDILPNLPPSSSNIVASATHFQLRIIFQDDPAKVGAGQPYEPSYVNELTLSWAGSGADTAPLIPPCLFYYKEYTFMSFPSRGARIADKSMAIDDFKGGFNEEAMHRWSDFSAPHYGAYFVVGGKLIGMPVSGGTLARLRNSDVTEFTGVPVRAGFTSLAMNAGSMYVKTLNYFYIGLVLNQHRNGLFQVECSQYPTTSALQSFVWSLQGTGLPAVAFGGAPTPAVLQMFGQVVGQDPYSGRQPMAPLESILLSFPNMKPYQAEYGAEVGLQTNAWKVMASWQPFLDTSGTPVFPTLTNLGFEFYLENIRGV